MVLVKVRLCVRDSCEPNLNFYLDYFLFLSDLHTFITLKTPFVSNGPIAQSVEHGANNGKVLCSRLIRTRFNFLSGLLSPFNYFAYIQCLKILICCMFAIKWSVCSVGKAWY